MSIPSRVNPATIQTVVDRDTMARQFNGFAPSNAAGVESIHVAGHGGHRRDPFELNEHITGADIPGMQNMLDPAKWRVMEDRTARAYPR